MKCINCNRKVIKTETGLVHARIDSWPELIHCINETADEIVIGQTATLVTPEYAKDAWLYITASDKVQSIGRGVRIS